MKKIINNKLYDTDTARELGSWDNGRYGSDFGALSETLYRKKTGEFFLLGEGGAATKYAQAVGQNNWTGGARIMPLSYAEARDWAEEHLSADAYQDIFGPVAEDAGRVTVTYSLSAAAAETIRRRASEAGLSASAYIESLLD